MKKTLLYALCAALLLTASIGCSKRDANDTTPPAVSRMAASIDGKTFSTNSVTLEGDGVFISVMGANNEGTMLVYIDEYSGKGTYPVGTNWTVPTQYRTGGKTKYAVRGNVTITAISPNIVGTFYFTCDDSTEVSNGFFTVEAP